MQMLLILQDFFSFSLCIILHLDLNSVQEVTLSKNLLNCVKACFCAKYLMLLLSCFLFSHKEGLKLVYRFMKNIVTSNFSL